MLRPSFVQDRRRIEPAVSSVPAKEWTEVALFKMLPRIIEFGPEILSAEEWSDSKRKVLSAVS